MAGHSQLGAESEAALEAVVAQFWTPTWRPEQDLVVIVGDGAAPVVGFLSARGQKRILVVQSSPAAAPPNMCVAMRDDDIRTFLFSLRFDLPGNTAFIHLASARFPSEALARVQHLVRRFSEAAKMDANALGNTGTQLALQGAANLPVMARALTAWDLRDKFQGRPLIVTAAGPSLAKNIDQLRNIQGRAIILAFEHTAKPLLDRDIMPDVVVTIDPDDTTYRLAGFPMEELPCLVCAATCVPKLPRLGAPVVALASVNDVGIDGWLFEATGAEIPKLSGSGSVSHAALSLGEIWGCDPIIFIGLDLAYTGNQAYVGFGPDGGMKVNAGSDGQVKLEGSVVPGEWGELKHVPCQTGGSVATSTVYAHFIWWFEDYLAGPRPSARVINATEGGALIRGMDHLPLAQALGFLPSNAPPHSLREVVRTLHASRDLNASVRQVLTYARSRLEILDQCKALATQAQHAARTNGKGLADAFARAARATDALTVLGAMQHQRIQSLSRSLHAARDDGERARIIEELMTVLLENIEQLRSAIEGALAELQATP